MKNKFPTSPRGRGAPQAQGGRGSAHQRTDGAYKLKIVEIS
ncbi:MAG: hypothetical protein ACLS4Z_03050 [Christensenellaceae bacterium]